jgi:Zn-finger nucleic acid-binding protein
VRCPTCAEPLIALEIESIEIDHCTACGGVWLDAGELSLLLEGAANRDALMAGLSRVHARQDDKRCPICSKKFLKVAAGTKGDIILDVCPRNDGLWFDRGELADVLKLGSFPPHRRVYELIKETFATPSTE